MRPATDAGPAFEQLEAAFGLDGEFATIEWGAARAQRPEVLRDGLARTAVAGLSELSASLLMILISTR